MKKFISLLLFSLSLTAHAQRTTELISEGWKFSLGDASSPVNDFGCGTEYFNYLTKANSIHNTGPYSLKFDDSKWQDIRIPHDWVENLPYASDASHSHGYKAVGYKFPKNSVGWYRKKFTLPESDKGKHFEILFEGIFRDSRVWVNGFYCGGERSGYLSQNYDITDYLNFGGENLICVRADATLEEGWFYEGAGIYRNVWLTKTDAVHIENDGIAVSTQFVDKDINRPVVSMSAKVQNSSHEVVKADLRVRLLDASGKEFSNQILANSDHNGIKPADTRTFTYAVPVADAHLWSPASPYLYTMVAEVMRDGKVVDVKETKFGIRDVVFDKDRGLILNGQPLKIKGVNMHQDHAGVGSAIPDGLQVYRIRLLKAMGCNAYRSSHNPMSPAMLDVCDSLGIMVIDENRLSGISEYELSSMKRMIERDRNHPSVILWSAGNEEWGIEWDERGERIAATMRDYCHIIDPTREMTFATSSGPTVEVPVDVAGYNYIMQNPVEEHRMKYPERKCYGSEETTGCGTRGIYFDDPEGKWMPALNRKPNGNDSIMNCIERGWKFYAERPWAAGLFYWTGFDYRGEPNPLGFPAVGSQFGILDYCGFPKDEAYYLKSWWTDETILHIFPHWNLQGHEGEKVAVWAYSNCDEVELFVNGKSAGRKKMPRNGHLSWNAVYKPGSLRAIGYKKGKKVATKIVETTGDATQLSVSFDRKQISADGRDVAVATIVLKDKKGRIVPVACNDIRLIVEGSCRILGVGNGDSAFKGEEHPAQLECKEFSVPAFNGYAQVILQSDGSEGNAVLRCISDGCKGAEASLSCCK